MTGRSLLLLLIVGIFTVACEPPRNSTSWSTAKEGDPIQPPLPPASIGAALGMDVDLTKEKTAPPAAPTGPSGKGVGPVDHVDVAALDDSRATAGAALFTAKCSACHKLPERYIGPALAGVTKRREPEWILNMILNPENMLQKDPTAKALLAEYIAPMANQHLTRDEAESVLAYFLQYDAAEGAPAAATTQPAEDPTKAVTGQ